MSRTVRAGARPIKALVPLAASLGLVLGGCASQAAAPQVSFPSAGAEPTLELNESAGAVAASASGALDNQSVGTSVAAKVTTPSGATIGKYPKGWVTFTVEITNSSGTSIDGVVPLVVFGPCSCDPAAGNVAPRTILQVFNPLSNTWTPVVSVSTNASGQYSFQRQVGLETLEAHGSLTYQFRAILSGSQKGMHNGTGDVDVYIMQQPGHLRITDVGGPDASFALDYHLI